MNTELDEIKKNIVDEIDNVYRNGYQKCQRDNVECRDKVYQQGYEDGARSQDEVQYQKGLEDAWDVARKIVTDEDDALYSDELCVIFADYSPSRILKTFSASEAIEKIREYEKEHQDDEIRVGDEVTDYQGNILYVVDICDGYIRCWNKEGMSVPLADICLKKTGKHIDGIAEVLKQMQE